MKKYELTTDTKTKIVNELMRKEKN
jgi:hypothetical protein